ncbi:MAG: hypothetical protein FWH15_06455 [Betaproteobacteria bacterium]|nr:hypothetical protein [Betaproteobacteria bacterium]
MRGRTFDLTGIHAITRGFVWSFAFRRLQPNRRPVDLTGLTARLEIFNSQNERGKPRSYPTEHPLGADGAVAFRLSGAETRAITATAARYRVVFTDPAGESQIYLRGRLAILEDTL